MTNNDDGQMGGGVDLTNCDREPIHVLGRVQSFGGLIATSDDGLVVRCSTNIENILGLKMEQVLGSPLSGFLRDALLEELRALSLKTGLRGVSHRKIGVPALRGDDRLFDIAMHPAHPGGILEIEPHLEAEDPLQVNALSSKIARLRGATTTAEMHQIAASEIRELSGFDRVMVYKFHEDGSGEIIAEARASEVESFLGLRYPASDIPKQARELYKRNPFRLIADVDDPCAEIEPPLDGRGKPLDLSDAALRAVSTIHLEYLRNMGVGASLSTSLIRGDELWGLIACHHRTPKRLSMSERLAIDLFSQMASLAGEQRDSDERTKLIEDGRAHQSRVMSGLSDTETVGESVDALTGYLRATIPFNGVISFVDGEVKTEGVTLAPERTQRLFKFLNQTSAQQTFATNHLSGIFPEAAEYADHIAGILSIPVSRRPRDYIIMTRKPVEQSVNWAGDPSKPVEHGPNGSRLKPRESFEAWKETVRNKSAVWTDSERASAEAVRMSLVETFLQISDRRMAKERKKSSERQALLINELNHRIRNTLSLVMTLVEQSAGEKDVVEITKTINDRIHALARAHDHIDETNWSGASVKKLFADEVEAYDTEAADRIRIEGVEAHLKSDSFITVALVAHELMTNAVKYGALSNTCGKLSVTVSQNDDGALRIDWVERDGPPVSPVVTEGLGTTLIEDAIPFELGGEVEVSWLPVGLRATLIIPAKHVSEVEGQSAAEEAPKAALATDAASIDSVLILEDNLLLAKSLKNILSTFGAREVLLAANNAQAAEIIENLKPDLALIDINLKTETSEETARKLKEAGTAFAFMSGYSDSKGSFTVGFNVPFLQKPASLSDVQQVLIDLGVGLDDV